jgi:raffinose/stachyose/melibiose transport system permease protein
VTVTRPAHQPDLVGATDPAAPGRLGRPGRPGRAPGSRTGWLFVAPALAVFGLAVVAPLCYAIWVAFFEWDGIAPARPVGVDNFAHLLSDDAVRTAFLHSLVLLVFYSVFPICIGLVFAAVIARQRLRLAPLWRTLLFLPQVLSLVVVGVAWQWILAQDGPFNQLVRAVGLGGLTRSWLGDFTWALPAEGAIGTWLMTGLCMVLLLAGAQALDPQLYDAAAVDGAGPVRQFFHITVPGLRNVIGVCLVLSAASSLNNFGLIWVTTQGGPGDSTQVLSTAIYSRAFVRSELGTASALAVVVFALMMVLAILIARRADDSA